MLLEMEISQVKLNYTNEFLQMNINDKIQTDKDITKGNKFEKIGRLIQAISQYQQDINLNEESLLQALEQLLNIYEDIKDFSKAIYYCQQLADLKPDDMKIFRRLINIYSKKININNDITEAAIIYKKLLKNANFVQSNIVHNLLGQVLYKLSIRNGQIDQALAVFSEAAETQPQNWWCYYNLGLIFAKQDQLNKAIDCYQKAIQIQPNFWQGYAKLGICFQRNGQPKKAFECHIKTLKINPDVAGKYYHSCRPNSPDEWALFEKTLQDNCEKTKHKDILYRELGQKLSERSNFSQAALYYQKSIYIQLEKSKPAFIEQYWDKGQLRKPDFLITGVMKCGTTSLYEYLYQHPQFLPAVVKEPKYLSSLVPKIKKIKEGGDWSSLDEEKNFYLAHFPPRPGDRKFVTGEASTMTIWSKSEQIVKQWFPNIKIIVILRNPIARAISHYNFSIEAKKVSLNDMITSELRELEATTKLTNKIRTLKYINWRKNLAPGLYVYYLKRWMKPFSRDQFLILTNENLAQNPARVMKQVFDFLGLPEYDGIDYTPRNVGSYPKDIDPNLISRLQNFYRPHNQKLEEFIGYSLNWDY